MSKPNISAIMKTAQLWMSKHSPEILTGLGIAGMVTTTVLAVKATPKALKQIEKKKEELDLKSEDRLTVVETVQATWKSYIPAAVTGTVSVACLIGASSVNLRRNTALAAAYHLSETALTEYKEQVIETIGKNKEKNIRDKVDKAKVDRNPPTDKEVIITGDGDTLCFDYHSGRYFKTSIDKLKKVENELNARLLREDYISLNDFYDEIGLSFTEIGSDLGWHVEKGLIEFAFSSQLVNDTPCLVLNYTIAPQHGYDRLYG
jgi:hypothetical protein